MLDLSNSEYGRAYASRDRIWFTENIRSVRIGRTSGSSFTSCRYSSSWSCPHRQDPRRRDRHVGDRRGSGIGGTGADARQGGSVRQGAGGVGLDGAQNFLPLEEDVVYVYEFIGDDTRERHAPVPTHPVGVHRPPPGTGGGSSQHGI